MSTHAAAIDEKGMEVAPGPIRTDGPPSAPRPVTGRLVFSWLPFGVPMYRPTARGELIVSRKGGTVSVLMLAVDGQVPWLKKNDQVASPRDPGGWYGPAGATRRLTRKTCSFTMLYVRIDARDRKCTPDGCVRGCTLTIVVCRRIVESRAMRITESGGSRQSRGPRPAGHAEQLMPSS